MTDRILALLAFAILFGFLAILLWHVPRLDLGAVVVLTLALGGYDTAQVMRRHAMNDRQK